MRICVFGAGAVGGFLAARLAAAGRDVVVVARGEHLAAIRASGLTLQTPEDRFTVDLEASDDVAAIGPCDLVLVTAKTTANAAFANAAGPLLKHDTPVVFVQNGVFWWYGDGFAPQGRRLELSRLDPDGVLHGRIGSERAMGMIVYSPNEVTRPGLVRNTGRRNRFVLGDPQDPGGPREARVAQALSGAGFELAGAADIRQEMWRKLAVNLSGAPLCALAQARSDQLLEDEGGRRLARLMLGEALAVAAAHGFDDLGPGPAQRVLPGSRTSHQPSLFQDLLRGRPMEIDTMLAAVADLARDAGVATPTLEVVLDLLTLRARLAGCYPGAA